MTSSSLPLSSVESDITSLPVSSTLGADYFIRQLIYNSQKSDTGITSFYENLTRNLRTLFGQFYTKDKENKITKVKCIIAQPERAIGKQVQQDNIILPVISLRQIVTEQDNENRRFNPNYSTETIWDDKRQRAIRIVSLVPKAITVHYELAIKSYYQEPIDQLTEQIQRLFNPSFDVNLPFTKYGKIFLGEERNETESQVKDKEDRYLVRSYPIEVNTHLPSPKFLMTSTGKLEAFNVESQIYTADRDIR